MIMLMKILGIVSCQPGSAGNGGRYRSACLSCRPALRATWRHFCILCTTQTFAYCVFCMFHFALNGDEGVGGKMLKALDLSYLNFKSKHILVALRTCILFLYIIIYSSLLERLGLWVWKITRRTTSLLCFVGSLASFIPFALQSLFCMFFMIQM